MPRTVHCVKLGKALDGLERPPFPGEKGQKIYEQISKEAWGLWMKHQTMLINENRLSVIEPSARAFLEEQMLKFLFEGGAEKPAGYVPPKDTR